MRGRASRLFAAIAVLSALIVGGGLSRPLSEVQQIRRHFADLQRQVDSARQSRSTRAADRGRVMRLRAQARAASGAQRESYEAEASALEARLAWSDSTTVRAAVLAGPMVTLSREATLRDVVPASPVNENGCVACHVAIATPGYEAFPGPFKAHPALSSYVGAQSPHPPSRVRCASCHEGDGQATSFVGAGHVTHDTEVPGVRVRAGVDRHATGAMLPLEHTEAGCVSCHLGERYQPGRTALNEALVTLERAGCYACHAIPGMEQAPKRGPDLRRINGKLSAGWVRQWLADPQSIKPATWMPAFWSGRALGNDDRAAIDAVAAYLFSNSDAYAPALAEPPRGDEARGRKLVESVGCLGCHVVGDAARDESSLRRTFGQPLQAIGGKTTHAWLFDWLRDPSRFSPDTRMPNLRLDAQETADIATYLESLAGGGSDPAPAPAEDDDAYRAVLRRYAPSAPQETAASTGTGLRVAAGRAVIDALGCFNCHDIRGFEGRSTRARMRQEVDWDEASIGALFGGADTQAQNQSGSSNAIASSHPGPRYRFGPRERERLALALTSVSGRAGETHALTTPWHLTKVAGRTLVDDRNCVGCHQIEGTGGDFLALVAEPALGPPLLTPEGSRVQAAWLRGFLHQPKTIRPWLSVRMPTFALSDGEVDRVGNYLRAIAPSNPEASPAPPGATAAAGKELFDLLKCQQCHVLGAIPGDQPASNLAPDLRMTRDRLQPEWILAWLRNPSAILPGTRMPAFWPDFPRSFYPALEGDASRQVRAISEHLRTLH